MVAFPALMPLTTPAEVTVAFFLLLDLKVYLFFLFLFVNLMVAFFLTVTEIVLVLSFVVFALAVTAA